MTHTILITQSFARGGSNTEPFDEFLDRVLDEFYQIGVEADYLANLEELTAEWTITIQSADELESMSSALTALRTALHAAGCYTPDWEPAANSRIEALSVTNASA